MTSALMKRSSLCLANRPGVLVSDHAGSLGSDCRDLGIGVINGSTPSTSPPAPFSFTVRKSGAGAAAAPVGWLLELLMLVSILWLQAI